MKDIQEIEKMFPIQYHMNGKRTHCIRYPKLQYKYIIWKARLTEGDSSLAWFVYLDNNGEIHREHFNSFHMKRSEWLEFIPLEILIPYIVDNKEMITEKLKEEGYWK